MPKPALGLVVILLLLLGTQLSGAQQAEAPIYKIVIGDD
jgi:hypothetical protein